MSESHELHSLTHTLKVFFIMIWGHTRGRDGNGKRCPWLVTLFHILFPLCGTRVLRHVSGKRGNSWGLQ